MIVRLVARVLFLGSPSASLGCGLSKIEESSFIQFTQGKTTENKTSANGAGFLLSKKPLREVALRLEKNGIHFDGGFNSGCFCLCCLGTTDFSSVFCDIC